MIINNYKCICIVMYIQYSKQNQWKKVVKKSPILTRFKGTIGLNWSNHNWPVL